MPRLWYSDLDSGPNSGGDANGGVYVTLYGINFGAAQGSSAVTIGGSTAFRYPVWTNTKIIVQLNSGNTSGPIVVTTAGGTSASLPFTVRTGNIYFVATNGSDSASGKAGAPWRTVQFAVDRAAAGDVIYVMNGISESRPGSSDGSVTLHDKAGTVDRPIALVAYPGASVQIGSIGTGTCGGSNCLEGIRAWDTDWWTVAGMKLVGVDYGLVITGGEHFRVVGNEMTCPFGDGAGACLESNDASFFKVYGNNVHDAGHANASALYHGVYFSTNSNHIDLGWNTVADIRGCRGLQTHSSGGQSQFDIKIHDNVIHDTQCDGMVLATIDPSKGSVEVYNNVIYNAGKGPNNPEGTGNWACIYVPGSTQAGPAGGGVVEVYNNTMYNCGSHPNPPYPGARAGVSNGGGNTNLSIRVRGNIIITPPGVPYLDFGGSEITGFNNLFFGNGSAPAGFANSVSANPLFVNVAARDFHLQASSPAGGAGIPTASVYDFDGVSRGPLYDIGAFQVGNGTGGGGGGGGGGGTSIVTLSQQSLNFVATGGTATSGQNLTISNTGTGSVTWGGSANQSWISFAPTAGTLAAGGSVTVTITPVTTGLAPGSYSGAFAVTGGTNGIQSSVVNLQLNATLIQPTASGIFRSSSGLAVIDMNGDGQVNYGNLSADAVFHYPLAADQSPAGDTPVVGDWNGDGRSKIGVYRHDGAWILDSNGNGALDSGDLIFRYTATAGDIPVVGDWNHDGRTKTGIFRNGLWILDANGDGAINYASPAPDRIFQFSATVGDVPIVGDWNNDGRTKTGIFRNGLWVLDANGDGVINGFDRVFQYTATAGDIPLVGDWNGSGTSKTGIYRNGLWVLDYNGDGIVNYAGLAPDVVYQYTATPGDIPVVGDWSGNKRDTTGIYRGGLWVLNVSGDGIMNYGNLGVNKIYQYSASPGDVPFVGKWRAPVPAP